MRLARSSYVTFIMLSKFCLLSNSYPLFLTENVKLDGMPTKTKSNLNVCFTLFQVLMEGTPVKSYKIQLPVFFISCCFISVFTAPTICMTFQNFIQHLSEKIFSSQIFFFFNRFSKTPHPLNAEQLKSAKSY